MPLLTLALLLQVLALCCFIAATFGVTSRVNLVAAGLSFFMASVLIV